MKHSRLLVPVWGAFKLVEEHRASQTSNYSCRFFVFSLLTTAFLYKPSEMRECRMSLSNFGLWVVFSVRVNVELASAIPFSWRRRRFTFWRATSVLHNFAPASRRLHLPLPIPPSCQAMVSHQAGLLFSRREREREREREIVVLVVVACAWLQLLSYWHSSDKVRADVIAGQHHHPHAQSYYNNVSHETAKVSVYHLGHRS